MSRRKLELNRNKRGTPLYSKQDFREQYCLSDKQLHCLDKSKAKSIFTCFIDKKSGECGGSGLLSSCYRSDSVPADEETTTRSLSRPSQLPERFMYHSYTPERHRYCYHSAFQHPVRNMTVEFGPTRCSSGCMIEPAPHPPPEHVFLQNYDCCHPPHARCRYNTHLEWFRHSAMSEMSPYRHSCCNPPIDIATRAKHVSFDSNLYRSQTLSSIGDQVLCQTENSNPAKNKSQERLLDSRTPELLEWEIGNSTLNRHSSRSNPQELYRKLSTRSRSTQTQLATRANSPTSAPLSRPKQRKIRSRSQCAQTASKPDNTASHTMMPQLVGVQQTGDETRSRRNYSHFLRQSHRNQSACRSPDHDGLIGDEIMINYQPASSLLKTKSEELLGARGLVEYQSKNIFNQVHSRKTREMSQVQYSTACESEMLGTRPVSSMDYGEVDQEDEEEDSDGVPPPLPPRDYQDEAFHETMMARFWMGSLTPTDKEGNGLSSGSSGGLNCVSPSRYFNNLNASQETVVQLPHGSFPSNDTASGDYAVPINTGANSFQSNIAIDIKPLISTASSPNNVMSEVHCDKSADVKPVNDQDSSKYPEETTSRAEPKNQIFTSAITINVANNDRGDGLTMFDVVPKRNDSVPSSSANQSGRLKMESGDKQELPQELSQNTNTSQSPLASVKELSKIDVSKSTVSKVETAQTSTRVGVDRTNTISSDRQIASVSPMTRSANSLDESNLAGARRADDVTSSSDQSSKTVTLTQYRRYFEENEVGELVEVEAPRGGRDFLEKLNKNKAEDKSHRHHSRSESRNRKKLHKIHKQKSEDVDDSATRKQQTKVKTEPIKNKPHEQQKVEAEVEKISQLAQNESCMLASPNETVAETIVASSGQQEAQQSDLQIGESTSSEVEKKMQQREFMKGFGEQEERVESSNYMIIEDVESTFETCVLGDSFLSTDQPSILPNTADMLALNEENPYSMTNESLAIYDEGRNDLDAGNKDNPIFQTKVLNNEQMLQEKQITKSVHFKDTVPFIEENLEMKSQLSSEGQNKQPHESLRVKISDDALDKKMPVVLGNNNLSAVLPHEPENDTPEILDDDKNSSVVLEDDTDGNQSVPQIDNKKLSNALPEDVEVTLFLSGNMDDAVVDPAKSIGPDWGSTGNDTDMSWPEARPHTADEDQIAASEDSMNRVSTHDDSTLQGISSSRTTLDGYIPLSAAGGTTTGTKGKLARQDSMPTEASDTLTQSETDTDFRCQKSRMVSTSAYSQRAKSAERAHSGSQRLDQRTRSEERNTEYSSVPTTSYFASQESSAGAGACCTGSGSGKPTDISTLSTLSMSSVGDDEATPGVYMGCFNAAQWLYVSASDEIDARKTTQQQQQQQTDTNTEEEGQRHAKLERSSSQDSTDSEKDFRRKFLSISHRMVHRRSCMNMLDLVDQNKFGENKCVVMDKTDGEFGFRIHGSKPVVVSAIEKGTPAEVSGLTVGDIILSINGTCVLESSHSDVVRIAHAVTDCLTLQVYTCDKLFSEVSASDIYRGQLWRRCDAGTWKKRWAALRHDLSLCFYTSQNDLHPVSAINLAGASLTNSSNNDGKTTLVIHSEKSNSDLEFMTSIEEDLQKWQLELDKISPFSSQIFHQRVTDFMAVPPSEIPEVDGRGVLHRLGYGLRGWQKMECVLKDGVLYMYKTANDVSALGVLYLHGYRTLNNNGKKPSFELLPPSPALKHFYFRAESEHHKRRWLAAFEYSIDRWIKLTK